MQFFKSLTEEQHAKICLPLNHVKRGFVSNWWYICPEQRLHHAVDERVWVVGGLRRGHGEEVEADV